MARLQDDLYYDILATEEGIEGAAKAHGIHDANVIRDILETQIALEGILPEQLTIGHVHDAMTLYPNHIPDTLRARMIDLYPSH